jgi:hypothetical protein
MLHVLLGWRSAALPPKKSALSPVFCSTLTAAKGMHFKKERRE